MPIPFFYYYWHDTYRTNITDKIGDESNSGWLTQLLDCLFACDLSMEQTWLLLSWHITVEGLWKVFIIIHHHNFLLPCCGFYIAFFVSGSSQSLERKCVCGWCWWGFTSGSVPNDLYSQPVSFESDFSLWETLAFFSLWEVLNDTKKQAMLYRQEVSCQAFSHVVLRLFKKMCNYWDLDKRFICFAVSQCHWRMS